HDHRRAASRRERLRGGRRRAFSRGREGWMKSLYLRIYATVVVVLLLFAFASAWVLQRHLEQERSHNESIVNERLGAWADLMQHSLPGVEASADTQSAARRESSRPLRMPFAVD